MASYMPCSRIVVVQSLCSLDDIINVATIRNGRDLVHMNAILEGMCIKCFVSIAGHHLQQYQELRACPLPQLRLTPCDLRNSLALTWPYKPCLSDSN